MGGKKKDSRGTGQGQKGSGTYTGARKLGEEDISDQVVTRGSGGSRGGGSRTTTTTTTKKDRG